jgi:hypothetical protein
MKPGPLKVGKHYVYALHEAAKVTQDKEKCPVCRLIALEMLEKRDKHNRYFSAWGWGQQLRNELKGTLVKHIHSMSCNFTDSYFPQEFQL